MGDKHEWFFHKGQKSRKNKKLKKKSATKDQKSTPIAKNNNPSNGTDDDNDDVEEIPKKDVDNSNESKLPDLNARKRYSLKEKFNLGKVIDSFKENYERE